jgi:hypothetical protein
MIAALDVRRRQLEQSRSGYEETGKPALNFNLGVGLKGGDDDFGESMVWDKPDITASLVFIKSLGNDAAKSDISRTDLQLRQLEYEQEKAVLDLEAGITGVLIQLRELERVLELNQSEIASARERTEEEIVLYNQGRSDLSFVIQSQDNEQNARLLYAENAASYHKLALALDELTDKIILTGGRQK